MEAIKVKYNGIQYRSKLEARWAVFFTHYGLKFEYEPQTFKLKSGLYCPDFLLPDLKCYAEVKPLILDWKDGYNKHSFYESTVYLKDKEYRKIQEFEDSIVLLCGLPLERNFILFHTVDLDLWNGFNCYPVLDKLVNGKIGWRWWSSTELNDYPSTCKIKECAEIARYYDFFNY